MSQEQKITSREQKDNDYLMMHKMIFSRLDKWSGFKRSSLIPYAETGRIQGEIIGEIEKVINNYTIYAIKQEREKAKKLITKEVLKELETLNLKQDKYVVRNLYLRIKQLKQEI